MKQPTRPTMHRPFDLDGFDPDYLNDCWDVEDSISYAISVETAVENDLVYLSKDLRPDYIFIVIRDICTTYEDPDFSNKLAWRDLNTNGILNTHEICKMCLDMVCAVACRFNIKLEQYQLDLLSDYIIFDPDMLLRDPRSNISAGILESYRVKFDNEINIFKKYEAALLDLGIIIKEGKKYKVGKVLGKGQVAHLLQQLIYPQDLNNPDTKKTPLSWKYLKDSFGLNLGRQYSDKTPTEDEQKLIDSYKDKILLESSTRNDL